jgi:hypothetical protein
MNTLESALFPLTLDDLKNHYDEAKCLVLEGKNDKFKQLVTLIDIERRLNDGANANTFPQTIKNGTRTASVDANCVWSPYSSRKSQLLNDVNEGNSFMMANSSQASIGLANLCDEIETFFADDKVHADVHLYVSTSEQGGSYNAHRDRPQHKILLQAYGDTEWQIFNPIKELPSNLSALTPEQEHEYLEMVSEFTLTQGDLLYMPPGTFHKVVNIPGPRISISIPFSSMPEASSMDRTFIPFEELFIQKLK